LVEINELIKQADHAPLLLLDDVFSELDETRRHALVNHSSPVQTVITTTNADTLGKRLPKNYASIKL
jgi:DNA replication and repair protein RecF